MSRGHFYARLEETDWKFIRRAASDQSFDAAIVKAPYLADYPEGDSRHGQPTERLTEALGDRGFSWALDPATAVFGHPRAAEWTSPRVRACPMAEALPLPWDPQLLVGGGEAALELLSRADAIQRSATAFSVPYLEVRKPDEGHLDANCSLIETGVELAGDRRVLAYLQTLRGELLRGMAIEAARRMIGAGAQTVAIRIRGLRPDSLEDIVAYLELVAFIEDQGVRAVADSVGLLGPTLVAGGADAFASGARYFQAVPKALLSRWQEPGHETTEDGEDHGGGRPILYQVPDTLIETPHDELDVSVAACPVEGCRASTPGAGRRERRDHNLHDFKRRGREAATLGYGYADVLRSLPGVRPAVWARALDQVAERRRAV
jgi:hypothetical protein